jgi:hypothetical protein
MVDDIYTKKPPNTQLFSSIFLVLWVVSMGVVSYLSLAPRVAFPIDFRLADLFYHFCAYLWLSLLPCISFHSIQSAFISALFMVLLGIGLEFGQYFIPGRVFSIMDIASNSSGVIIGTACGLYLRSLIMHPR